MSTSYQVKVSDDRTIDVTYTDGIPSLLDSEAQIDICPLDENSYSVLYQGRSYHIILDNIDAEAKQITFLYRNNRLTIDIIEPMDILLAKMGINMQQQQKVAHIKAPMPGLVSKIMVTEGQNIQKGDPVLILEAMKMENVFKSPSDATIKAIKVAAGTAVEKGAVLIELA